MATVVLRHRKWHKQLQRELPYYKTFLSKHNDKDEIEVDWEWLPGEWNEWDRLKLSIEDADGELDPFENPVKYSSIKRLHAAMLDLPDSWPVHTEFDMSLDLENRREAYRAFGAHKRRQGSIATGADRPLGDVVDLMRSLRRLASRLTDRERHEDILEGAYRLHYYPDRTVSLAESIERGEIEQGDSFYTQFAIEARILIDDGYVAYTGRRGTVREILGDELPRIIR